MPATVPATAIMVGTVILAPTFGEPETSLTPRTVTSVTNYPRNTLFHLDGTCEFIVRERDDEVPVPA